MSISSVCALCLSELPKHPIHPDEKGFCCVGCQTVFSILYSQNALENYQIHPLFQQAVRAGLISNPALIDQIQAKSLEESSQIEVEKVQIELQGMWCPSCAEIIKLFLLKERGIRCCTIDYSTDLAVVEYYPRRIGKEAIFNQIRSLGYQAISLMEENENTKDKNRLLFRFILSAFCTLNLMMLSYPIYASYFDQDLIGFSHLLSWISFLLTLPVISYCAWPIIKRCISSISFGYWGMETLVMTACTAAFILSSYRLIQGSDLIYFDSLSAIITFVLLGKIIEKKAKFSTKVAVLNLMRSLPKRGRKKHEDGSFHFVSIKEIFPGDVIAVYPGEKIVVDGTVITGEASCDESLLTGEALPVLKKTGDRLIAGSLVCQGRICISVTSAYTQSTLHHIISSITQQIEYKPPYKQTIEKVLVWFVPCILLLAGFTASFYWRFGDEAVLRAISVLLIACPCAIGIAAPVAESHLMNRLAALGAIVKNRGCLSLLGRESVFVFDKTGTITEGKFTVLEGLEHLTLINQAILRTLSSQSTHPIAHAITKSLPTHNCVLSGIEEFSGKGITGVFEGQAYYLGSPSFLQEQGIAVPFLHTYPEQIVSRVFFASQGQLIAVIMLKDQLRPGVKELISQLAPAKAILLSGDSHEVVQTVGKECGFHEWHWSFRPLEKRNFIERLKNQGHIVCMLGDGINDAPALAGAHIGVSVISASDISVHASDLLLTTDVLAILLKIRCVARKGQQILKQNIFWAFAYNVIGIGLALNGTLSPLFAAFAMMTSSTIVLFNARRLDRMG